MTEQFLIHTHADFKLKQLLNNMNNTDKALIPNAQLEMMFLRICTDEQMNHYANHVNSGNIALATAYVSKIVTRKFFQMIENEERNEK